MIRKGNIPKSTKEPVKVRGFIGFTQETLKLDFCFSFLQFNILIENFLDIILISGGAAAAAGGGLYVYLGVLKT